MTRKNKSLTGQTVRPEKCDADGRDQREQLQDNQLPGEFKIFDIDTYRRNVQRALADAAVLVHDWPGRIRYSYFIGSNGKLLSRCERRAGK